MFNAGKNEAIKRIIMLRFMVVGRYLERWGSRAVGLLEKVGPVRQCMERYRQWGSESLAQVR